VDVLKSPEIAAYAPLQREAMSHVAHPAIRNRGTLGGSLAHADPASELPACMVVLDATIIVRGLRGERRIAAIEFFTGIYETALSPQELIVAIEVPVARMDSAFFFHEYARRHGDYAIVGLAAQAIVRGGRFADLRLGFFAVGDRPLLADAARKLVNVAITREVLASASAVLSEEFDPQQDQQANPAMRRHLANVLLSRCVSTLLSRPDLYAGATA
jgi:carbon-monoxide dehydrogenase medium subunit